MKIAFIHNEKKLGTGAHYINDLISTKLKQKGAVVKNFYPKNQLMDYPQNNVFTNIKKDLIPNLIKDLAGSILFIPSRYEGFSLSLIEGMSQGLIPIIYDVGVASEIIKNGVNGFVVKSQTEAIKKAKMIIDDEKLRKKMCIESYKTAQSFRSDILSDKLFDFYNKIIKENKKNKK